MKIEDWIAGAQGQSDATMFLVTFIAATLPNAEAIARSLAARIEKQQQAQQDQGAAMPYIAGMNTTLQALVEALSLANLATQRRDAGEPH